MLCRARTILLFLISQGNGAVMPLKLIVNDQPRELDVDPQMPLLWAIRDHLQLTGTKFGCGMALCGACTVHIEGQAVRSCVTPVSAAEGKRITTIEGLATPAGAPCRSRGCISMCPSAATARAARSCRPPRCSPSNPKPTDADIDAAMAGNLCRCATYVRIRKAIHEAAACAAGCRRRSRLRAEAGGASTHVLPSHRRFLRPRA